MANEPTLPGIELPPETRKHHKYSPSTLQPREACCWYDPRNEETEAAAAGTLQHEAFDKEDLSILKFDEQHDAVEKCLDYFRGVIAEFKQRFGADPIVLKEQYVPIDEHHTTAGYFDWAVLSPDKTEAVLGDLKFGRWPVEPTETNLQGHAYALGLRHKYPSLKTIKVVFLMPYLEYIDEHTFTEVDFMRMYTRICTVVARAKTRATQPVPTMGACVFCANIGKCPAVANIALSIGKKYAPIKVPEDVAPSTVAYGEDRTMVMTLSDLMAAWAKGVRSQITSIAIEEQNPPEGYRIKTSCRRSIVDKVKFKEVALRAVPADVLDSATDYSFTPIEDYISKSTPRGQKTQAVEQFAIALEQEGAVKKGEEFSFLEMVKTKA